MTVSSLPGRHSALAAAIARVESFLLEPEERTVGAVPEPPPRRPVVAVIGLAPRAGATTVARALAAELAVRDPCGAAAVTAPPSRGAPGVPSAAAARLARDLAIAAPGPAPPRLCGRLCLTACADLAALSRAARHRAPLALDVARGDPPSAAASLADHVLLVAGPGTEPALAEAVRESLARAGPAPLVVLNRADPVDRGHGGCAARADFALPDSAVGARLGLGGRAAPGRFGEAVAELADRCEAPG